MLALLILAPSPLSFPFKRPTAVAAAHDDAVGARESHEPRATGPPLRPAPNRCKVSCACHAVVVATQFVAVE